MSRVDSIESMIEGENKTNTYNALIMVVVLVCTVLFFVFMYSERCTNKYLKKFKDLFDC